MRIARAVTAALVAVGALAAMEDPADPWIDRIEPFGGTKGSSTEVSLVGRNLSVPATLEFDSPHLSWETVSLEDDGSIRGIVRAAPETVPGPYTANLSTPLGRSNSRLFYVDELASTRETEPNSTLPAAQRIRLEAQTLHGSMPEMADVDYFAFEATAGERWTFDLRSIEYGGFLENDLSLLDTEGRRVAFSDDRDEYLETPFLEHVFEESGTHYLKLDQYRGPQRVNCNKNCGYMLRIGDLPVVDAAFPLGARVGSDVAVSLRGRALDELQAAWLAPVRRAEYYRLTFPFTIPVQTEERHSVRLEGRIESRSEREAEVRFEIPAGAWQGLWRLWVRSPGGLSDTVSFEISAMDEPDCGTVVPTAGGVACNGWLERPEEEQEYRISLSAGQPLVATTLAAQLGLPRIDTVLELFGPDGQLVAEHDDLMTGQGTVIGNPDSMLQYRAERAGTFRLLLRDRIGRGGPDMAYRLRIEEREPGFALLSDPENPNARPGTTERLGVLLIPEPGFVDAVDVWVEGESPGLTATKAAFRADQFFGPSGDGDNVVIPEEFLSVKVSADVPAGDYPLRIMGRAAGGGAAVEALSTLWIGPPRKRNDVRRPLESVRLTVLNPDEGGVPEPAAASGGSR